MKYYFGRRLPVEVRRLGHKKHRITGRQERLIMRKIWICFFILWSLAAADVAAQVDRIELGYQTTKRGIVWYRSGLPTHVPYWKFSRDTNAVMWHDTLTSIRYDWDYGDDRWRAKGTFSGPLPPPAQKASGSALIDYRTAYWIRDTFNLLHKYDSTANAWTPWGDWFYMSSVPTDIAATGTNGAAKYRRSLWQDSDDNFVRYWDGDSWEILGAGVEGDVITLADSAALKAYTGVARGVVLRQFGREGLFTRSSTTIAHDGYMIFTDGLGRKWKRVTDGGFLNVKWFGAKGDGVTDDRFSIQRAIDYAIYTDSTIKQIYLPTGEYKIGNTLHLGYGKAHHSVSLRGDGSPPFRGGVNEFSGTNIAANFSNAPALNIQGARYSVVEDIAITGLNDIDGFIYDTSSANINNWIDPAVDTLGLKRYTPYAGITIDAYSGGAPSPSYPIVSYPTYAGISGQYAKLLSSQVKIKNVSIHKFIAGIVVQPNADGNGDFVQIEKAIIDRVTYGISVGNSQSRSMRITDVYLDAHTCITNSTHGQKIGRISAVENCHFGGYQWFSLAALPYLEGFEVNNCYGEGFYWLGTIGSGIASSTPSVTFNGCGFAQTAVNNRTLQSVIELRGDAAFNFNGCVFHGNRIYQFFTPDGAWLNFRQCMFGADVFKGEVGDSVEDYHNKFFRSFQFIMSNYPERVRVDECRFNEFTETNPLAFPQTDGDGVTPPTTMEYISYWRNRFSGGLDIVHKDLGRSGFSNVASAFSSYGITNRAFTGKINAAYDQGVGPGDLLLFTSGSKILPVMVTAKDEQDTISGLLMTGYIYDASGHYTGSLYSTTLTGTTVMHISCRKFFSTRTIEGDFTSGSPTVTNVRYVYDNAVAASGFDKYTPLMNADGIVNISAAPVTVTTYVDSVLSTTSLLLSENATKTGRFEVRNCFIGNSGGDGSETIVTAGTNITVTGNGNSGNPYVINNTFTIGPGAATQVAYWTGTNTIGGENELWWDATNNRLGIGYNTPGAPLQIGSNVAGNDYMQLNNSSSGNPLLRMFNTGIQDGQITVKQFTLDATYAGFSLNTNLEVNGRILTSAEFGAPGINSLGSGVSYNQSTPGGALRLRPVSGASSYINFVENGVAFRGSMGFANGSADFTMRMGASTFSDGTERFRFTGAGRLGIASNNPQRALHVEGEARISDLTTDPPVKMVGADADGDLGGITPGPGTSIVAGVLTLADTSATNEIQQIDTFALVGNTIRASLSSDGVQYKSINLGPILAGLNGIYGDGTAGSGSDALPTGGSSVTIPGLWQPLQFNANTGAGQVWSTLVVNAATCSDDRVTKYLVGKSPQDSLEVYGYDCGSVIKATGGQLTLQSNKELITVGDSIYMATVPEKTTLGGIIGFTQYGSYLSQIKGTATDQVLKWNNTGAGHFYMGTDNAGSGTLTGAENGLNVVANKARLGGNLITAATSIEGDGNELRFFDGKFSVSSWTGYANTPVQPIRFQGQEADPTTNTSPTLDGIIEYRLHNSGGSDQSNSITIGGYATDADGMWIQSRSAAAPNVKYPLSLQPRGGLFSVGRLNGLDALATFAGAGLSGTGVAGNVMHLENTGGNAKAAMGMGVGTDILDSEIGYFDGADALRITNRNATTGTSSVRIAVGGETSDKVIVVSSSVTPNARMGVGHTATTTVKSTIDNKGSYAAATTATTGNLTLTEAHHTVRYTLNSSPTFTLPSASDCPGREYIIHHFGSAGNIILSQNIISSTGTTFNTIPARHWAYIQSDGADWYGYRLQSL